MELVERKPGFKQVCLWPGMRVRHGFGDVFEFWCYTEMFPGIRIQFLEDVTSSLGEECAVFAVHKNDIEKFLMPRFQNGIRWIEDVFAKHNKSHLLFDKRLEGYMTWDPSEPQEVIDAARERGCVHCGKK